MPSRRTFLASVSSSCALMAMPSVLKAQSRSVFEPAYMAPYQQGELTATRFTSVVGSTFRAQLPNGSWVPLQLLSVVVLNAPPAKVDPANAKVAGVASATQSASYVRSASVALDPKPVPLNDSFVLRFLTGGVALQQESYVLDHGTMGRFVCMLTPGSMPTGELCASATFILGVHGAVAPAASKVGEPIVSLAPVGRHAQ